MNRRRSLHSAKFANEAETHDELGEKRGAFTERVSGSQNPGAPRQCKEQKEERPVGEVWTTAAWAMVLVAETPKDGSRGLPAWFGRSPARSR